MAATGKDQSFRTDGASAQGRLDTFLRRALGNAPWSRVRALVQTGKVRVDGAIVHDPAFALAADQLIELRMNAPRASGSQRIDASAVVYVDAHVIVVSKPPGVSSVPYEPDERDTLRDLVRAWLNRTAKHRGDRATGDLGVVHRIDKETSGLLVFTRTLAAKRHLANQMRFHTVERRYLAVAHGSVRAQTIRSRLVANRGDGLRGSTRLPNAGVEAITHVEPVERLAGATLVACTLETGRTHQIRIHLSEAGHPLLGDRVYVRNAASPPIPAPRLMLHAAVLGFVHPVSGRVMHFEDPMPEDMRAVVQGLRIPSNA